MVNLGNTLFAKSHAIRLSRVAQEREDREKAMRLALETTREVEEAKDREFDRQRQMAEMEAKFATLAGAPTPTSRNEKIAQALNLGGLGGRAQQAQTTQERAFRTGERQAGQQFQREMTGTELGFRGGQSTLGHERGKELAAIRHGYDMERLRAQLAAQQAQRKAVASGARPKMLRDEMKYRLGNFSSWARNLGQKERLDIASDPETGALSILSNPTDPNRRAIAELIATANNIAYGARSPEQIDHLMYMLTSGATPEQLEAWWMGGGIYGLSPEQTKTPYSLEQGQGPMRGPLAPAGDTDSEVMDAIRGGAFEYSDEDVGPSVKGKLR